MAYRAYQREDALRTVRSLLLAAAAFLALCAIGPPGYALDTVGGDSRALLLPSLPDPSDDAFGAAFYRPSARQNAPGTASPALGRLQVTLGRKRKVSLDAFTVGTQSLFPNLAKSSGFGFAGTSDGAPRAWDVPQTVLRTSLDASKSLDQQAQAFKVGLDGGRGKLSLNLQNVGTKFSASAGGLDGMTPDEIKALTQAAGTRTFNLEGSYQLSRNAAFSSTRKSLYNDKPGDGNRGRTTTDWVNTLSLTMGKSTSLRLGFTDHDESANANGQGGTRKRTTEFAGETKFGAAGRYNLRFGLRDVQTLTGGQEQSEKTQEFHLALPLHSRLRLSGDYTRKEDAAGNAQVTNLISSVLQLYRGAELTANWKTLTQGADKKKTDEMFLKLTGGLGGGGSALKFAGEQTTTRTVDQGMLKSSKFDLSGGLGTGRNRLNLKGLFQERRADTPTGPLEQLATFHLDRAFGSKLTLTFDSEQKQKGTVAEYEQTMKSVAGLTATLSPVTKLTAGFTTNSLRTGTTDQQSTTRDLTLEHRMGKLQVRAEDHRTEGPEQKSESLLAIDWPKGSLPDWAQNLSRRHEFTDIYEYRVAQEANWLDLPFAGTRLLLKQRTGGPDDGADSLLVSHRTVLAKRYHLQLTYHERPDFEEGDKKGRPQTLRRQYVSLGMPFAKSLVVRTWLTREQRVDDLLSERRTLGFGVCGKLKNGAQTELHFARDTGQWESKLVDRNVLALMYHRIVDEEHKLSVKLGYAWGASAADGHDPDYRITLTYANPL